MNFNNIINKIINKKNLTSTEANFAFDKIISGKLSEIEVTAFLTSLASKGPSAIEIYEAAKVLRQNAKKIKIEDNVIDTCGTGGDGKNTLNISTATAILASACDIKVAKHGNKAVSSKSGSSDVLSHLGVNINANMKTVKNCLNETGLCFLMAPLYHTAMKNVAKVRNHLKIKTIFNILGPLINPANADRQLIGVYEKKLMLPMAETLKKLGVKKAWIVSGQDGLDEITISTNTLVVEVNKKKIRKFTIYPERLGIRKAPIEKIKGKDAKFNAKEIMKLLMYKNYNPYFKKIVILNASACLVIANKVKSIEEGMKIANKSLINGKALTKLKDLISASNE